MFPFFKTKEPKKTSRWQGILFWFVFASLAASVIFAAVSLISAPVSDSAGDGSVKIKSDYTLMIVQCLLGIAVMFLPSFLTRHFKLTLPNGMYVMFIIFLYAAIYLGEVRSFYYRIPNWDMILHTFSGVMLGALGFSVVDILNKSEKVKMQLSPFFVSLFSLCFAVTLGVLWEFYEYTFDGILGLNMQKFAIEGGAPLMGRAALQDTMEDLLVDMLGALISAAAGYMSLRGRIVRQKNAALSDGENNPKEQSPFD